MSRDLRAVIAKVGRFVLPEPPSEDLVEAVYASSTFQAMKNTAARVNEQKKLEGRFVKKEHFRKGQAGLWKENLTAEEKKLLLDKHHEKCASLGIDLNLWEFES